MLSHFSHVQLFVTLWTIALQAPLSMGFSRQEYWSGLPCPLPRDLPDPGIEPTISCLLQWQVGPWPQTPCRRPHISEWPRPNIFPGSSVGKESACQCRRHKRCQFFPRVRKEDPLEEGMATHSSILAGKVPWTEEPDRLRFMESQRVKYDQSVWVHTSKSTLLFMFLVTSEGTFLRLS